MVTKEDIIKLYKDTFTEEYIEPDFAVEINDKTIRVARMYEYLPFNTKFLFKLAEMVGTDNLNVDKYHRDGCETCDYGSSYTMEFTW